MENTGQLLIDFERIFFNFSFWRINTQLLFQQIFSFCLCAVQCHVVLSQRNPSFFVLALYQHFC